MSTNKISILTIVISLITIGMNIHTQQRQTKQLKKHLELMEPDLSDSERRYEMQKKSDNDEIYLKKKRGIYVEKSTCDAITKKILNPDGSSKKMSSKKISKLLYDHRRCVFCIIVSVYDMTPNDEEVCQKFGNKATK